MPYRKKSVVRLVLLYLSLTAGLASCYKLEELCKDLSSKSAEHRLKTHLFCDYDEDVRPQIGGKGNATNISFMLMPRFISFDDLNNAFEMNAWSVMNWTDPHLTWNPEDFDGLESIQVNSDTLWTPDITVHNAHDAEANKPGVPKTNCELTHDAQVLCVPVVKYKANCQPDYTDYPYDLQVCSIDLASWAYSTDEVNLLMSHKPVTSDLSPGQEWNVLHSNAFVVFNSFKMNESLNTRVYTIIFLLARRAETINIVFIVPAFVLMALTLCSLWLDCNSSERIIVSSVSFICHLTCIQYLFWAIPFNGDVAPMLLHYYENSFLIMAFVMILTVLGREFHDLKAPAPEWLSSATSFVLESKFGQLMLLSILDPKASAFLESSTDDNDELFSGENERHKSSPNTSTWNYIALLIGWVAFILVFFVYLVMLFVYLPYKPFYDPDFITKL